MASLQHIILVAEDEMPQRLGLVKHLVAEGYRVIEACDGAEARDKLAAHTVDLAILDIMMPKLSGYDLCRSMRKDGSTTPVIMLTAKAAVGDRIEGFDCGADDYVTKPFSIDELLMRIGAILRRTAAFEKTFSRGDWSFDFGRGTAQCKGKVVAFTHRELELLELLIARQGCQVTRDEFLDRFWPPDTYPTNRTVDTLILGIRKKLSAGKGVRIETVHRAGYRLA